MRVGYAPAAPVAKLDKAPVYETGDCWFESSRVRQVFRLGAAKAGKASGAFGEEHCKAICWLKAWG